MNEWVIALAENDDILALDLCALWVIVTVEKASFEQLNSYDGKYELKKHVDDHDVEDVLQRVDHTVKHSLKPTNPNDT